MARKPKHGEATKDVTVTLPPTAIANLDAIAKRMGISRSELIAKIGLGEIAIDLEPQMLGEIFTQLKPQLLGEPSAS